MSHKRQRGFYLKGYVKHGYLNIAVLETSVQVDEAYIGCKEKNKHSSKKLRQEHGAVGKTAVIGIRDEKGTVRSKPIRDVSRRTLQGYIRQNVSAGSTVVAHNFLSYSGLHGYTRRAVNHSITQMSLVSVTVLHKSAPWILRL